MASTRTGASASPRSAARSSRVLGVLGGGRRDEHERRVAPRRRAAARKLHIAAGGSHMSGPTTCTCAGQRARVLELREGGDERELAADAAVHVGERRQAEPRAGVVELDAAALEAPVDRPLGLAPERAPGGGARQARAERVDREVGLAVRVDVGDERRAGPAARARRRARGRA